MMQMHPISADVAEYCLLKSQEYAADWSRLGDEAQAYADQAERQGKMTRAFIDAILAPYGVTLAQLEKAELP